MNIKRLMFLFCWQVDLNVTRHLDAELHRDDWDITILHYLGLDHIGHLAGPSSPLVKPKLDEMSGVIKSVYDELVKKPWKNGIAPMVRHTWGMRMS